MKKYNVLSETALSDVCPEGWIRAFLESEKSGMPGNLHRIGYPYDRACWQYRSLADGGYEAWWPYEQTAYWIDSVIRTAVLLRDEELYSRVRDQVEKSFAEDGDDRIGPVDLFTNNPRNRWPHGIYFRAIWALCGWTGDDAYLRRIVRHYLADRDFDYGRSRDIVSYETMLRLAEKYGEEDLKKAALAAYTRFCSRTDAGNDPTLPSEMRGDRLPHIHGVTLNEQGKMAAVVYAYTGDRDLLDAAVHLYEKLDRFHVLPDGVHSSSEATCGSESWRTHESCDISDYTWALGYLLEATGDGKYADRIEYAIFNALPGAIFPGFTAIQYLSCVNQPIAARNSTHIEVWKNTPRMAYQPHHYPECCVGNIGRAMPNYCARMYQTFPGGLAVSLYGPGVYDDGQTRLEQTGNYPFEDEICMRLTRKDGTPCRLKLRIPAWNNGYLLTRNGEPVSALPQNGYVDLDARSGDEFRLTLRKSFASRFSSDGGVYFTYGPFLMTLKIREKLVRDTEEPRQTTDFPAWNIYPDSPWNWAVSGWETPTLVPGKAEGCPFWTGAPFEIRIKARRLEGWELIRAAQDRQYEAGQEGIDQKQKDCGATEVHGELLLTPNVPGADYVNSHLGEEGEITLVPYGCTTIRLTVFPRYTVSTNGRNDPT